MSTTSKAAAQAVLASITPAIAAATHSAVRREAVGLAAGEAVDTGRIVKEVSAVVINQTNNEPWFLSRVTLFAIGGILTTLYTAGLDFSDGTPPTVEAFSGYLAAIGTQFGVLYGRWVAKKPLGN
ncbi:hypothetical protein J2X65_003473 [Ancylobacter sp. 3268]|uniref:hypothetical protein n=1 Tax=Ancylobacter sp. 3268 TaxID=2817752 RepID=UPI002856E554|nr:hypothetical protein [Ancylobacter sp. 3268]MDR6954105.1 hypothetical protein [Ancylobacter sp. 3268]